MIGLACLYRLPLCVPKIEGNVYSSTKTKLDKQFQNQETHFINSQSNWKHEYAFRFIVCKCTCVHTVSEIASGTGDMITL